jgi:hypothetical protein
MKCLKAKQLIQEYLDHHISEEEKGNLEQHIQTCSSCREEFKKWENFFSDVKILSEKESAPAGMTQSIMSQIQNKQVTIQPSWWERLKHVLSIPRFSLKWIGAAAVALVAFTVFINFNLFSPGMNPNGLTEVQFSLRAGAESLSSVAVVGDFNDWNPNKHLLRDENEDGIWTATLRLEPGRYEYMFILDGQEWVPDPEAYRYVRDGFGNKNAVIEINNCS